MRRRLELEAKVRRAVVPVLERRADTLGIPPARRGSNDDGPFVLAVALAEAIRHQEDSAELPFGDTLEVGRDELNARLAARAPREDG
ncbi:MAG TPA: hypothetical protein RMH99_29415 [Sandaracinaceae bacterium LLY-WYZ-13_1]|nr:hypothetical protein [Sandaracinaceae bacterium LLY-WYZ-13_1]